MPNDYELERVIDRASRIQKYMLYSVYKDCLASNKTDETRLSDFVHRCSNLGLGKFNSMMYFFFQWQVVLPNDEMWREMNSYLEKKGIVTDGQKVEGKFYSSLLGIKWIVGYRMAQTTLLEQMDKLDYGTNWKTDTDVI